MTEALTPSCTLEQQEEVLVLVGHDEIGLIDVTLQPALEHLVRSGLVAIAPSGYVLTDRGRAVFDRLLMD